jgi:viologen exporter family transport system permease protein
MIQTARRHFSVYASIFGMVPKIFLAYQVWFWIGLVLNVISMSIVVFFWRAIYADTESISGLARHQTITYVLLAFIFRPLTDNDLVWEFGSNLREGMMIHHLLRPVNFQGMNYAQMLSGLVMRLVLNIPMVLFAVLLFDLQLPSNAATWLAFIISALLGFTVMFYFNWFLACFTFYTTEIWGLGVLIEGMTFFLSGALVPLVMMPEWLRTLVLSVPFAQALAVPVGLLTGITPLGEAPNVWLIQVIWIVSMWIISTLFFRVAIRKITVQGG